MNERIQSKIIFFVFTINFTNSSKFSAVTFDFRTNLYHVYTQYTSKSRNLAAKFLLTISEIYFKLD